MNQKSDQDDLMPIKKNYHGEIHNQMHKRFEKIHVGGYSKSDIRDGVIGTLALPLLGIAGYQAYKHFSKPNKMA